MQKKPITREEHVRTPILECLETSRIMTTQEITKYAKARISLTETDKIRANRRDNESKIDQIIANALQEKTYLCKNELIKRVAVGEFVITPKGVNELETERKHAAEMLALEVELDIKFED